MTLRPAPPDAEIGRTPHRDRSTSASRAVVVQCVVVSRMSRASPLWVGSTGARVCQGRSVDVAHSCALRVSRNPGIMRNSNVSSNHALISHVRSPPLTAHGSPTAAHDARRISPSFQQKPAPTPQRPQSPMCNTDGNHTRQAYPSTPHTEIGRVPARDRFDFGPADPTSRHARRTRGQRPHATIRNRRRAADRRQRNRSRGGIRPISAKWRGTALARSWPAAGSRPARSRLTTPAGRPDQRRDRTDGLPPCGAAESCGRCRPRSRSANRPRPPPGGRER